MPAFGLKQLRGADGRSLTEVVRRRSVATILLGEGAYAAIDLFMVVRGLVTAALVVGVAPSPVQVVYRLTATYAVKGTQIIGLNITSDTAIDAQAVHFIDAVYGPAPAR